MSTLILFNKPFQVLSQFRESGDKATLSDYIDIPRVYPAGRLDYDSEGLLLLTDDGQLQARISNPQHKLPKTYCVQVEGDITGQALEQLRTGVMLKDGPTRPARVRRIASPAFWDRSPPVRFRKDIPTSWIEIQISEGRNRQVRRMTASVGHPTLRLVRTRIGQWSLGSMQPGELMRQIVHSPRPKATSRRGKPV